MRLRQTCLLAFVLQAAITAVTAQGLMPPPGYAQQLRAPIPGPAVRTITAEDLPKVTTPLVVPTKEKPFSQRHPLLSKAAKAPVHAALYPFKLFGKTKAGKAFYKEVSLCERDLFEQVAKVDDRVSPYSNVFGVTGSLLNIGNAVRVWGLH